jgi:hypothetical protein
MAAKEKQMGVLGGKLLLEAPQARDAETATSARLRYAAEEASLRTVASAVSAALTRVLRWHVWWQGISDALPVDVTVDLANEFFSVRAWAEEVKTAIMAWQSNGISFETLFERLQVGGWAREGVTAEQELAAIDAEVERRIGSMPDVAVTE